jgi:RND family efflux transporter MFP subunit
MSKGPCPIRRRAVAAIALCLASSAPARADDAGVALITTAPAKQGTIPDIVTAYGSATPALEGGNAISLQQDGRVAAILVTQGERVRAGDRLLVFDLAPQAISAYQQAVSAASLAQSERAHTAQLMAQKLATRDQLAQADKAVTDSRATLDALQRQGADRTRTQVAAPYAGIVNTIPVAQGDRVTAGAPLMTLTRLDGGAGIDGLVVTVGIEPALHARVQAGQPVSLHRLPDGPPIAGRVLRVDGVVNVKTRLVDVDIGVPPGAVLSGESFGAAITLGTLQGWIVPHDSVLNDERGDYLFQVGAGKAARVDVTELGAQGDEDAVTGKLDAARPVIVDGATQLADGDAVRTQP